MPNLVETPVRVSHDGIFFLIPACPDCPVGRTCTFAPGNPNGTCECSPGTVENKDGDCVHCIRKYQGGGRGGNGLS